MFGFGFNPAAHLTEADPRATNETAKLLFAAWSRFWKMDRRVLVEKSPPNIIKLRFFQRVFGEKQTRFVVILRHPFAAAHYRFKNDKVPPSIQFRKRCYELAIRHWLALYQQFVEDLQHLNPEHVLILQFERLMGAGLDSAEVGQVRMQTLMNQVYAFLDINPPHVRFMLENDGETVTVPSVEVNEAGEESQEQQSSGAGSRRNLLNYHGDHFHVSVLWSDPGSWIPAFHRWVDHNGADCLAHDDEYEALVNRFGYSLRNLTHLSKPEIAGANVLW